MWANATAANKVQLLTPMTEGHYSTAMHTNVLTMHATAMHAETPGHHSVFTKAQWETLAHLMKKSSSHSSEMLSSNNFTTLWIMDNGASKL